MSWFTARLSCRLEVTQALNEALSEEYIDEIDEEPEILDFTQARFEKAARFQISYYAVNQS